MRRVVAWPLVLGLLLLPRLAYAGRVAVLADGGRAARLVRAQLVGGLLDANLEVLSEREYDAAARRLGIIGDDRVSPGGVRRIAAVAAVDAVLHAHVFRHRRRDEVRVTFYDALGERHLDRTYRLHRGRLGRDDLRRLVRFVARQVPASAPMAAGGDDEGPSGGGQQFNTPPPGPPPRRRPPPPSDDTGGRPPAVLHPTPPPPRRRRPARRDDLGGAQNAWRRDRRHGSDDGFGTAGWGSPGPGDHPVHLTGPGTSRLPYVSLVATGGGGTRTYHLKGQFTEVKYSTAGLYPVAGGVLDLFPFAGAGPLLEGIGVEGTLDRGFLTSQFVDGNGQAQSLQTPVLRWTADLRYRVRVSPSSPWSTAVGLRIGYGSTDFSADLANAVFTGVHQSGVRLGLEATQPIAPPYLALSLVAVAEPFAQPGQAEATAYGPNASAAGYSLRIGLTGGTAAFHRGLVFGVWLDLVSMSDQFKGTGSRDSNAKATEQYLAVTGGLGYAF